MKTNLQSGTTIDEVADSIYRISTPLPDVPGGFSFNQYLVVDERSLLFHTGPRRLFPLVREAVAAVLPVERLRYVGYSHFEADECGSLNEWLAVAPNAEVVCSRIGAMTSAGDIADRPPRGLADGEEVSLGAKTVVWLDAPHVPHGWDCGYLFESRTRTLLCGDLFTQPGVGSVPVTEDDIFGPSEAMRKDLDYYAIAPETTATLSRFAELRPRTLACMHGSAWRGDGSSLLLELARTLAATERAVARLHARS